ncbi:AraC family transcriptional regulator [Vibrio furnissii]|uniref:AraC family transcriptional regulator n=1 Tax=Vibrio furnissii TaxID=29494 RepID=A0A0Q2N8P9_VIBFU|nr:helix-turn-helix domain-containing protein [Vibrio furnissii]KQH88167.1 AraC family transcriptional regulator [Vibrio furnissii]
MGRSFSTQDVRAQEGFAYWQHNVERTFASPTHNRMLSEEAFHGELDVKSLGRSALISRIRSTPIEYGEMDDVEYSDDYFICLSLCPLARLTQSGVTSEQHAGDIVMYDNHQPFRYTFPQGDNQIVISVPHALVREHIKDCEAWLNVTLKRDAPLVSFVAAMLEQAWLTEEQEEVFGDQMLRAILMMLGTAFQAASGEASALVQRDKRNNLALAQHYIEQQLGDPALSVASISSHLHMSARTLSRLFAKQNTSVMRWVWLQRLKACRRMLLTHQEMAISDIAYQQGFSNLPHFNKLFKEKYGMTPSQMRDSAA